MVEFKEIDIEGHVSKLKKDLSDINKRETIELAKPLNSRKRDDIDEIWAEKNKMLSELNQVNEAAGKLKEDVNALRNDEKMLRAGNEFIEKEI